jgi:uncharacterized protein DUF3179
VYGRDYEGRTLNFEASGGLANSSLIMQDKQTDTYWSIMSGKAEAGSLKGTSLVELPVSEKVTWREWVAAHPETLVLSARGIEDPKRSPYDAYFADSDGFRGAVARDNRLETKDPVFAFLHRNRPHAADHRRISGGKPYDVSGGLSIFLYRQSGDELFRGTAAFQSGAGFEHENGVWTELGTGAQFDPEQREFTGGAVLRLNGFDTFWYNWSLTNSNTKLLR